MKYIGHTIIGFIVVGLLILTFVIPYTGWHIVTSNGEHKGFITSAETTGLVFKTHTVYVKTDTQSSQEDSYCVVDDEVFKKLKDAVETKEPITVVYIDWFSRGIANCNGELAGVITGIK